MFQFGKPKVYTKNTYETEGIVSKTIKKLILSFYRRFYDSTAQYADKLIKTWTDNLIVFLIDIFFNGLLIYWFLFGLIWVFPKSQAFIVLGHGKFFPVTLFSLGMMSWLISKYYRYFRIEYRGGKK